jgi:hypothetical protein
MTVQVVKDAASSAAASIDFVRVETYTAPDDDTVTLATIERIVDKNAGRVPCEPAWRIKRLVHERPMSAEQAVGFARLYAERKGIPVVLTGGC